MMTRLPFDRLLLSAALMSVLAIPAGCDVDESDSKHQSSYEYGENIGGTGCPIVDRISSQCALITSKPDYFIPGTHPRFNPAASDMPLNTDILFSGSTDGTALRENPSNAVETAIGKLDGWSVSAAFNILMSGGIDGSTLSASGGSSQLNNPTQNVFLLPLETVTGGDPLNPEHINRTAPFDMAKIAQTLFSATTVSIDGGTANAIRISPTVPLLPKKKYLVIVTNGIKDATAKPITASAAYDALGSTTPLPNAALQPVRNAINAWEQLAVGFLAQRNAALNTAAAATVLPTDPAAIRNSLALTYTFTTTEPNAVMLAMAAPRAAVVQEAMKAGASASEAVTLANNLQAGNYLPTPKASANVTVNQATAADLGTLSGGALPSNVGRLYTGAITLPYFQATPQDNNFFTSGWTADQALGNVLSNQLGQAVPPADNDGTYNVTYRYPFAGKRNAQGLVKVPLQVTLPNPAFIPAHPAFGGASCGAVQSVQSGYPVVIYVHGITSDRASVVALAHSLAKHCVATVAIDLPMHGLSGSNPLNAALNVGSATFQSLYPGVTERHFNLKAGPTGAPVPFSGDATDSSGSLFINLGYAVNSRDNIRQAVVDLLNLNASLGTISGLNLDGTGGNDLNLSKVYLVGVSLGGMVGSIFAAVNQQAIAADAAAGFSANLNPIKGAILSVGGGQLTKILENSPSFSTRILPPLAAQGLSVGTENFERFMYVFQSMIDPADPINFARPLASTQIPLLLQEIVGGGTAGDGKTYTKDKVVPNNVINALNPAGFPAPLAGTDPWASLIGASATAPGSRDATASPILTRLSIGHHASLLRPNEESNQAAVSGELLATAELQTQVVSFVLSEGKSVAVGSAPDGSNQSSGFIAY